MREPAQTIPKAYKEYEIMTKNGASTNAQCDKECRAPRQLSQGKGINFTSTGLPGHENSTGSPLPAATGGTQRSCHQLNQVQGPNRSGDSDCSGVTAGSKGSSLERKEAAVHRTAAANQSCAVTGPPSGPRAAPPPRT
jgi:hypothetical protein